MVTFCPQCGSFIEEAPEDSFINVLNQWVKAETRLSISLGLKNSYYDKWRVTIDKILFIGSDIILQIDEKTFVPLRSIKKIAVNYLED